MPLKLGRSLIDHLTQELTQHLPFSRMNLDHVRTLAQAAQERYAKPDQSMWAPEDGVPSFLFMLREGRIVGISPPGTQNEMNFELEPGDFWPTAALLAQRRSTARYLAKEDCFYFCFPWAKVQEVMGNSVEFSDYLNQRIQTLLKLDREQIRTPSQPSTGISGDLDQQLMSLPTKQVLVLSASESIRNVLQHMSDRKVGSAFLADESSQLCGIFTRRDVLDRVTLSEKPLSAPISQVMSAPVQTIDAHQSLADAALMMTQLGIRHLPVMSDTNIINVVSEHDLFAHQQQSLRSVNDRIQNASGLGQLQAAGQAIRDYARHLMIQGTSPRSLTRLISNLNDRLSQKIIRHQLATCGLSDKDMCWLALGSEGREEQTIATDQDNALIFLSDTPDKDREKWLAFAMQVNQTLDACGYPLCKGGVMASDPRWCKSLSEWKVQTRQWINRTSPEDLLRASTFFDMRGLVGRMDWANELKLSYMQCIASMPRFIHAWVARHLETNVALNWHGGLSTQIHQDVEVIDLKLHGTAIAVDAARILALSVGCEATSTSIRIEQAAQSMGIPDIESKGWLTALDHLQMLRLRRQILSDADSENANKIPLAELNGLDRQMLKLALNPIRF
jgi:CBS domain-containing protein